ncbi:MAG TPA: hypothetical protein VF590_21750 [Isosphaeraceae bacterium]
MSLRTGFRIGTGAAVVTTLALAAGWDEVAAKKVAVVAEGRLVRGAWQRPGPLRRLIEREGIRTIVTLTAINQDDPKYVAQAEVVRATGVAWVIVPMRGSRATLEQMAEAADVLADQERQPVFFHCVGGHHRTSLVHAAFRIRHQGWSADRAWREVEGLPWTRPEADADREDRRQIEAFAAWCRRDARAGKDAADAEDPRALERAGTRRARVDRAGMDRLAVGDGQRRDRRVRSDLPLGAAEPGGPGADPPRPPHSDGAQSARGQP